VAMRTIGFLSGVYRAAVLPSLLKVFSVPRLSSRTEGFFNAKVIKLQ
jgi:hypothetical protein